MAVSDIRINHDLPRTWVAKINARMSMDYETFIKNIDMADSYPDEFRTKLMEHRGGCRCCDPGAHPPCSNCTRELTYEEVVDLGYIIDASGQFIDMDHEWPTEIEGEWVQEKFVPKKPYEPDVFKTNDEVMAAVRAMCS